MAVSGTSRQPSLPTYAGVRPKILMRLVPGFGKLYTIVWSGANRWLLAGTHAGLVGWKIDKGIVLKNGVGAYQ